MEFQFRALAAPPAFAAGNSQPMLETARAQQRRVLYNIYLYLIMIIECAYRQYPTQDQERCAREQLARELDRSQSDA